MGRTTELRNTPRSFWMFPPILGPDHTYMLRIYRNSSALFWCELNW
jgi:hypothetical protein